jgi:hypothetical protein
MSNDQWEMPNVKVQMPKGKMQITNDKGKRVRLRLRLRRRSRLEA